VLSALLLPHNNTQCIGRNCAAPSSPSDSELYDIIWVTSDGPWICGQGRPNWLGFAIQDRGCGNRLSACKPTHVNVARPLYAFRSCSRGCMGDFARVCGSVLTWTVVSGHRAGTTWCHCDVRITVKTEGVCGHSCEPSLETARSVVVRTVVSRVVTSIPNCCCSVLLLPC
jgi:hypothetical protein